MGIILLDIILWLEAWQLGVGGIFGLIGFFIGYRYSVEMSIAPREFWVNCQYDIVKKKIQYGWTVAVTTTLIASFIIAMIWTPGI